MASLTVASFPGLSRFFFCLFAFNIIMEVEVYYTEPEQQKKTREAWERGYAQSWGITVYIFPLYIAKQRHIKDQLQLPQSNKLSAWDF